MSQDEHQNIVLEDHDSFSVSPIQGLSQWAYITKNTLYITDIKEDLCIENGKITQLSKNRKESIFNAIHEKSPEILPYQKKLTVLEYYETLKSKSKFYSDGKIRHKGGYIFRLKNILSKIKIKLFKI